MLGNCRNQSQEFLFWVYKALSTCKGVVWLESSCAIKYSDVKSAFESNQARPIVQQYVLLFRPCHECTNRGGISSLFQNDTKNKMFDWIHFHWAHYSPAKPIKSNPYKPRQNGYFQGDWQRLGFYVGRKRDQSSKPFTFFWVITPDMVPDIHPWEIDALARVNPGDWSLVLTKVALVCLFQNASYSLHFLDVKSNPHKPRQKRIKNIKIWKDLMNEICIIWFTGIVCERLCSTTLLWFTHP